MTQSALPDLQTIALVDAGSDHPDAVFGRCTVAYRPGAIDAAAVPAAQADAARPVILFTTSGTTQGPKLVMHSTTRSEENTSELQSLMRISYAVFCLKKKKQHTSQ